MVTSCDDFQTHRFETGEEGRLKNGKIKKFRKKSEGVAHKKIAIVTLLLSIHQ
jgi:hypothetical protein